jgi:hypothetical protein
MTETAILQAATALVREPFELNDAAAPDSEAALLDLLAEKIGEMMEQRPEYLMSLLYRLDVAESQINAALHPAAPESAWLGLARLVLARQRQRVATKTTVKPDKLEGMEGWEW